MYVFNEFTHLTHELVFFWLLYSVNYNDDMQILLMNLRIVVINMSFLMVA